MSPRVRQIIHDAAVRHCVHVSDVLSRTRGVMAACDARAEAMYRVRDLRRPDGKPVFSFTAIGQIFDRDHTSVITAVARWQRDMAKAAREAA